MEYGIFNLYAKSPDSVRFGMIQSFNDYPEARAIMYALCAMAKKKGIQYELRKGRHTVIESCVSEGR